MQFTKLFSSILDSTIWQESLETKVVWVTMLAMSDKQGEVMSSIPGLAKRSGVTIAECEQALQCLLSPDPYSRTKDFEGRRIESIDGGWQLLNHSKYRALLSAEERREYNRRKQAQYRENKKKSNVKECQTLSNNVNDMSITVNHNKQSVHITEAEAEAEANKKSEREHKNVTSRDVTNDAEAKSHSLSQSISQDPIDDYADNVRTPDRDKLKTTIVNIQALDPNWKRPLSYTEQISIQQNLSIWYGITDEDWQCLNHYFATKNDKSDYWRPKTRSQLLENISDVLSHLDGWKASEGKRTLATANLQTVSQAQIEANRERIKKIREKALTHDNN